MSESTAAPRHGRRARRLDPEEAAAQAPRTGAEISGEMPRTPGVRGAVAAPGADAPVPALRKFGKRARIIELTEDPAAADAAPTTTAPADASAESAATAADPAEPVGARPGSTGGDATVSTGAALTSGTTEAAASATGTATATAAAGEGTATIVRDADGVELGELSVSEAPDPRPAPRFDGKVLHRPERSGGRPLLWIVWALIALAIIALVVLLLTGILGGGSTSALAAGAPLDPSSLTSSLTPTSQESLA